MLGRRWVFVALFAAAMVAMFLAKRGGGDERHAYATCLTSAECLKGELCAVNPKDDGFATLGTCASACTDDAQCLNGWKCAHFANVGAFLVTPGTAEAKQAKGPTVQVCAPPVR